MFDQRLLFALGVVLVGGVVLGYSGFGTGLIFVALLSLIYSPREAVAMLMIMGSLGTSMLLAPAIRRTIWRETAPMMIVAILAIPIGSYVLLTMDQRIMQRIIGVAVFGLSIMMFLGVTYKGQRSQITNIAAGVVSGVVAGATGLGRLLVALYFISANQPVAVQRANIIIVGSAIAIFNLIILMVTGVVTIELAVRAGVLFFPFALTIWLGAKFFSVSAAEWFRRLVLSLIMIIAVITIFA
jgi:uncharacterized membrane protein YfcA